MAQANDNQTLDLAALRERLAGAKGQQFWRSLGELADTPEFRQFLHREFPRGASELRDAISRRTFLKLMGASLALAGLSACGEPHEKIVPYVRQPPEIVPGESLYYATAMTIGGIATGVLVQNHAGRPTKIEGNPRHPASLGATDIFAQAALLTLYDPDRSQAVLHRGEISTWDAFLTELNRQLQRLGASGGAGLRFLTETITSPTLAAQIEELLQKYPAARWHQYQAVGRDNASEGARLAFGQPVNTIYHFDQAARILALDADFLHHHPGHLRYAREFADARRMRAGQAQMSRLYVVESAPTVTGANADHRLAIRASQVEPFARAVAQRLGVARASGEPPAGIPSGWLDALVRDLQGARGRSIVIAGDEQPPAVHLLAQAINAALGNVGQTVTYTQPVEASLVNTADSLRTLVADMAAGQVSTLIIVEGNPVFDAPADLGFADALNKVGFRAHLGLYVDETARMSHWHIPMSHFLEAWGDARAFDGTVSIMQPLIAPLYDTRSAHELLAALQGQLSQPGYTIVRGYWNEHGLGSDAAWQRALHDGVVEGSALPAIQPVLNPAALSQTAPVQATTGLELIFRPDPTIWDGRFANNGWLQELPKPLTTLTWDNAALIAPATAARLGLANHDLVELRFRGRSVRAPIWVLPGQPADAVTVTFGYGRAEVGRVGAGIGFNAFAIRPSDAPWFGDGLEIVKTGERYLLATTQDHFSVEGRDLAKVATLAEFAQNASAVGGSEGSENQIPSQGQPSLLPEYQYNGHRWGMAIDTNICIGCNACTIACQAENNIPVVGKDQVAQSREMHWLKVDQYYQGDMDAPQSVFQPRPCMQCEKAPCELVCPVGATVHSAEGLNDMVYNRCVGTRYCSNNCPYKVRRFNFFQYSDQKTPVIQLMYNPEVTVRDRGVMEKCTYCVQRITAGRIESEKLGRPIADGAIKTACQEVCPTQAIVFGDLNDPSSVVAKLKAQPHNYGMLAELGTQPRTTYLAKVRNPNPEIAGEGG